MSSENAEGLNWKPVFQGIFWPAAAGSVFWSLCTLVVGELPEQASKELVDDILAGAYVPDWDTIARLVVLLLLAAYLTVNWMRVAAVPKSVPPKYWVFDFFHLWTIAFCAIAAESRSHYLEWLLVGLFLWAAIGHLSGAFSVGGSESVEDRRKLARANIAGVFVLIPAFFFDWPLLAPASLILVLVLWGCTGRFDETVEAFRTAG